MSARIRTLTASLLLFFSFSPAIASDPAAIAERQDWRALQAAIQSSDVNAAQPDGMTALFWAVYYDNTAAVNSLLAAGAAADIANRYGLTPLMQAGLNGNADVVRALLQAGASPNARTPEGDTALMHAARGGSADAVRHLLEHGANIDVQENFLGQTALMWAAGENHHEVVSLLLDHGADIDLVSPELDWQDVPHGGLFALYPLGGLTALDHAIRENAFEAARVLLSRGADPNIPDPQGLSPLRIAVVNAHFDIAGLLIDHGADINEGVLPDLVKVITVPIRRAAPRRIEKLDAHDLLHTLLDLGVDVDAVVAASVPRKDGYGGGPDYQGSNETALYLAASAQDVDLMRLFVDRGADLDYNNGRAGDLPLIAALFLSNPGPLDQSMGGHLFVLPSYEKVTAAARLLLDNGADINATNAAGATALHQAAADSNTALISFLINNGARLDIKDSSNRTPLDIAQGVPHASLSGRPGQFRVDPAQAEAAILLLQTEMERAGLEILSYEAPEVPDQP